MECRDFHALSHAYALGSLQAEEARHCEAHLADPGPHDACAETLARSRATVAWLGEALVPVHPGEHVWRHVTLRLGIRDEGRQPMRRREQAAWAVALLALAASGVLWPQVRQLREEVADRRGAVADLKVQLNQARQGRALERLARVRVDGELFQVRQHLAQAQARWPLPMQEPLDLRVFTPLVPGAGQAALWTGPDPRRVLLTTDLPEPGPQRVWTAWLLADAAPPEPTARLQAGQLTTIALDLAAPGLPAWTGVALSLEPVEGPRAPIRLLLHARLPGANVGQRQEPGRAP
jgi:hypothetical protein